MLRIPLRPSCVALAALVAASACGLFPSPYDAITYEHLTELKALHLSMLDEFTEGGGKRFDADRLERRCGDGRVAFRAAVEYEQEKGTPDRNRVAALGILLEQFDADCTMLRERQRLLSADFGRQLAAEVAQNYHLAIRGEVVRRRP
jgi:hypothetical protein